MRLGRFAGALVLAAVLLGGALAARAEEEARFPQPTGHVVDEAGLLQPNTRAGLELLCREVKEKTGAEVAAALVPSIAPLDIETYATELFERWGVGSRETDEGVLLVVARDERKVRFEVGYGLEGILPDGKVGGILRSAVVPYLKENNWDAGIAAGLASVSQVIAEDSGVTLESLTGDYVPQQRPQRKSSRLAGLIGFLFLVMFLGALGGGRRGRGGRSAAWLAPLIFLSGTRGGMGGGFGGGGGGFGGFGGGMSGGGGASSSF
jgi:uncharacterized protein